MTGRGLPEQLQAAAGELAYKDDLTGLYNRRLLSHLFAHWWDELCGAHRRLALIILDLDGFKEVNDTLGHLAGDRVLRRVAEVLRHTFRGDDVLVRYGGDEFVVLLPGAGQAEASSLGRRARDAVAGLVAAAPSEDCGPRLPVSFSLGVAVFPEDGARGEDILARADERLYAEKRRRRPRRRASAAGLGRVLAPLALSTVFAAALVATVFWSLRGTPPTMTVAPAPSASFEPAAPAPSARELALLEEIERLRKELALRETKPASGPPAGRDRPDASELRARIEELEAQLDGERLRLPEPTPAPGFPPPSLPPFAVAETAPAATPAPAAAAPPAGAEPAEPASTPPRLLRHEAPEYPVRARQFRREAVVDLRVTVDASGRVTKVRPVGTPVGLGFEEAARRAAITARYVPAMRGGRPVEAETILSVVFRLDAR